MSVFDTGRPLTAASDNLHISTVAIAICKAADPKRTDVGDSIDRGLIALRLLNEAGYDIVPRAGAPTRPPSSAEPISQPIRDEQ